MSKGINPCRRMLLGRLDGQGPRGQPGWLHPWLPPPVGWAGTCWCGPCNKLNPMVRKNE